MLGNGRKNEAASFFTMILQTKSKVTENALRKCLYRFSGKGKWHSCFTKGSQMGRQYHPSYSPDTKWQVCKTILILSILAKVTDMLCSQPNICQKACGTEKVSKCLTGLGSHIPITDFWKRNLAMHVSIIKCPDFLILFDTHPNNQW
jgi:hypothetical protein